MELGKQSQKVIQDALKTALGKLAELGGQMTMITDIHLQPCMGTGELLVFDDEDNELACVGVAEWSDCVPESFYTEVAQQLRPMIERLERDGLVENLPLAKPYSFVLVDDERETVTELLLVDDDTLMLSDGLLKGLDEELDAFLKELLES